VRRLRGDGGATTVEFALVLPVFLVLMGTGAYFGWYVHVNGQLERAAGRAARYASVPTTSGGYGFCPSQVLTVVNNNLVSERAALADITVQDSAGTLASGAACTGTPKGWVRVTVAHTFSNPFTSLVAAITPVSSTITLTGTAQAAVESP
jgi:Flp pilus assembly protein TadG